MGNEEKFLLKFRADIPALNAMGDFVREKILLGIAEENESIEKFLKISPEPRLKDEASLIGKAFHRGKSYVDPYNDITDKIGLRFVVLTLDDIKLICKLIESTKEWKWSLDRDFESDREENPHFFDYQSMHYVVFLKKKTTHNGIEITKKIGCEIQIRTLMQHAYCELSHGVLYKPKKQISKGTTRSLTRSVALIEAVDDYFSQAEKEILQELSPIDEKMSFLSKLFSELISTSVKYDDKTNIFLLSHFSDFMNGLDYQILKDFFSNKKHIVEAIKEKSKIKNLYKQPIVLLFYYLIGNKINLSEFRDIWPLDEDMIRPIFTDFGDSIDRYNL